ncbi:hypothetical protein BJY52DRAFT_1280547 [Lactarius psammicola]|nr:hypothetical protein BJY52DRAFT_1280547 [Lactarius psammicola]
MNVHGYGYGYWYADKSQLAHPHQHMNLNLNRYVSTQEYSDPYDIHLHHHQAPFTNVTLFELAPLLSSPTSTCTSSPSSNSGSSPGPCRHSDDVTSSTLTALTLPSESQMEAPARSQPAETPVQRRPEPRRPSSAPAPIAADSTNTGQEVVGRRTPKSRRTPRAVQPLACFFCRGRKIACGPPVNLGTGTGDRTCEPCARRRLVCEYPAESYRGRRPSGPKTASGRPQRR